MQADPHMHNKLVYQVYKWLARTEGQIPPGLVYAIVYVEEILHLFQNIINVLFMVEKCDVIKPGTQHDQKSHEVRFGSKSHLLVT